MTERFGKQWHTPDENATERAILLGTYEGEPIVLGVQNTFLRIFGEGNDHLCNQVIHTLPSKKILALWLHDEGLARFKDELLNGGYAVYHAWTPEEEVLAWMADEIVPNCLTFPEPEQEAIEKLLDDIQAYNNNPDYTIPEMRRDATSIAMLDSATTSGWLQRPRYVRLNGLQILNSLDTEN